MKKSGFTVIELVVVFAFLLGSGIVLLLQLQRTSIENSNSHKKIAINAIYYSLEESYYPTNKHYPEKIDEDTLKTLDPELLTDPEGIKLGEEGASYRYEPKNCKEGKCTSYTLRSTLYNEDDFVKDSRDR